MTTEGPEATRLLYTSRELAQRLGLPRWRVLALARSGSLPHFKIGRLYHFEAATIARCIEETCVPVSRSAAPVSFSALLYNRVAATQNPPGSNPVRVASGIITAQHVRQSHRQRHDAFPDALVPELSLTCTGAQLLDPFGGSAEPARGSFGITSARGGRQGQHGDRACERL